eukprot:9424415-Lingulodinium_polyedra.AAC.1
MLRTGMLRLARLAALRTARLAAWCETRGSQHAAKRAVAVRSGLQHAAKRAVRSMLRNALKQ